MRNECPSSIQALYACIIQGDYSSFSSDKSGLQASVKSWLSLGVKIKRLKKNEPECE